MKNAWAIGNITEEVIKTSKQLGVENIIHYGGPGQTDWLGRGRTYQEYKDHSESIRQQVLSGVDQWSL